MNKAIVKPKQKSMRTETIKPESLVNCREKNITQNETKKYKKQLKGCLNPNLRKKGKKTLEWIFNKKFEAEVIEFVNSL